MARNLDDILAELSDAEGRGEVLSVDYLKGLVQEASVQVSGAAGDAETLLYSGMLNNGVHSGSVAQTLAGGSGGRIVVIGQTDAAALVENYRFRNAKAPWRSAHALV
ncbi:hypothetical protein [Endothiovibrio diazotrophicus]